MDGLRRKGYMTAAGNTAAVDNKISGLALSGNPVRSAFSSVKVEATDVMQGRVSLAALMAIILLGMGFYYWTRGIQGGG